LLTPTSGRYDFAKQILSDNGTQFVNDIIEQLMLLIGSEHYVTMSYSKEENAIVESSNKETLRHLRAILFTDRIKTKWLEALPFVQRIINKRHTQLQGSHPQT
jgi:hypothetical protein